MSRSVFTPSGAIENDFAISNLRRQRWELQKILTLLYPSLLALVHNELLQLLLVFWGEL